MARRRSRRLLIGLFIFGVLGGLIATELKEGRIQARFLAWLAADVHHAMEAGQNPEIKFPDHGPFDERLGYAQLPDFIERLTATGAPIEAQARWSDRLQQLTDYGLFALHEEKSVAGLRILDRAGRPLYDVPTSARAYARFEDIPTVVAWSLMFIENRELLDPDRRHRNPAVEWDRMALAVGRAGVKLVQPGAKVPGASTLATQMEKYRHSPDGRTEGAPEKLRQMASAAVRAYLDGPDTSQQRLDIVRDYLNTVPLAAWPGHGEVHGFGDGLHAFFGTDFRTANALLEGATVMTADDPRLIDAARVYRQSLALLLSLRRPGRFLVQDHAALEEMIDHFLDLLYNAEVIPSALRTSARAQRLAFQPQVSPEALVAPDRKGADAMRIALLESLGIEKLYDLDRLDLTVRTTLDLEAQRAVSETLAAIRTPEGAKAAGLVGPFLLGKSDDPAGVQYSFTFYERVGGVNVVRVLTDSHPGQFSLNEGMKLELGSTAKLRTLVSWLELVAELHALHVGRSTAELKALLALPKADAKGWAPAPSLGLAPGDTLQRWVVDTLRKKPGISLPDILELAMDRKFSASPNELFFTGGGMHRFNNFDEKDDRRTVTVRDAMARSINLAFIRIMREVVQHLTHRDGSAALILANPQDPRRRALLERFAAFEGADYLEKFVNQYGGLSPDMALEKLAAAVAPAGEKPRPERLAVVYRSVRPEADFEAFARWFIDHYPKPLRLDEMVTLYEKHGVDRFSLQDRGYIARRHPLELWVVTHLHQHPQATTRERLAAAMPEIPGIYAWLLDRDAPAAQDTRIRIMLEQDAFAELHRRWQRLGFPFEKLVPSYGTALGSSGDRPAALAELAGIISAGGLRHPLRRITRYHFAEGTPYETIIGTPRVVAPRVMLPEVAKVAHEAVLGVVERGTGRVLKGAFGGGPLAVGGKTGTGDNRIRQVDARGRVVREQVRNRTATLVFLVGERWFGVVTAFVPGEAADAYSFTSGLVSRLLKHLAPKLLPAFGTPEPLSRERPLSDPPG